MEIVVIILLIIYAASKDYLFYIEREKLQKKFMSKNLEEYVAAEAPEAENAVQEENPYIPLEEATIDQILKAKEFV